MRTSFCEAIVGPCHGDAVERQGMAGQIRDIQFILVEDRPGFPFDGQVARRPHFGLSDHHFLVLPVNDAAGAGDGHGRLVGQCTQDLDVQAQVIPAVRTELFSEVPGHHDFVVTLFLGGGNVDIVRFIMILLPIPGNDQLEIGFFQRCGVGTIFPALGIHIHRVCIIIAFRILPDNRRIPALTVLGNETHPVVVIGEIRHLRRNAVAAAQPDRVHSVFKIDDHAVEHGMPDFRHRDVVQPFMHGQMHRIFHADGNRHLAGIAFQPDRILADQIFVSSKQFQHLDTPHHETGLPVIGRTHEIGGYGKGLQLGQRRIGRNGNRIAGIVDHGQRCHFVFARPACREQLFDGSSRQVHLEKRGILLAGRHAVVQFEFRRLVRKSREEKEIDPGNQIFAIAAYSRRRRLGLRPDGIIAHQRQRESGRRPRRLLQHRNTGGQ